MAAGLEAAKNVERVRKWCHVCHVIHAFEFPDRRASSSAAITTGRPPHDDTRHHTGYQSCAVERCCCHSRASARSSTPTHAQLSAYLPRLPPCFLHLHRPPEHQTYALGSICTSFIPYLSPICKCMAGLVSNQLGAMFVPYPRSDSAISPALLPGTTNGPLESIIKTPILVQISGNGLTGC